MSTGGNKRDEDDYLFFFFIKIITVPSSKEDDALRGEQNVVEQSVGRRIRRPKLNRRESAESVCAYAHRAQ